jgi:hypothetical protein
MKTGILIGLSGLVAILSTVACSSAPADGDDTTDEGALRVVRIEPGTFKLYQEPNHVREPGCDVHVALELARTAQGSVARLERAIGGPCALMILPEKRQFRLHQASGSCGAKIYTGTTHANGTERSIKISDYRSATCAHPIASLVVEETDADGSTKTLYPGVEDAPEPGTPGVWLTYIPKQCGGNPWNGAMPMHAAASSLSGEVGTVDTFFRAMNIKLTDVGFLVTPEQTFQCMACQCARGDLLIVHAKDADDAKRLKDDYGFSEASAYAVGESAKSCNTNPWDPDTNTKGSARELGEWAVEQGANASFAGFVQPTEPVITCQACGCPRGDQAVVIGKSASAREKLEALGFAKLQ